MNREQLRILYLAYLKEEFHPELKIIAKQLVDLTNRRRAKEGLHVDECTRKDGIEGRPTFASLRMHRYHKRLKRYD